MCIYIYMYNICGRIYDQVICGICNIQLYIYIIYQYM